MIKSSPWLGVLGVVAVEAAEKTSLKSHRRMILSQSEINSGIVRTAALSGVRGVAQYRPGGDS
jgi:hypothetical protein